MKEIDKKTLCGIACVFFGLLFLIKKTGLLDSDNLLLDPKLFPLYLAAIFLYGKEFRIAGVFGVISAILWLPSLTELIMSLSDFFWPILLIVIGGILIFTEKRKSLTQHKNDSHFEDNNTIHDDEFHYDEFYDDEFHNNENNKNE